MANLEEFFTMTADLESTVIGACPSGLRLDAEFHGTATSPQWEGERPVSGVDYVTVDSAGHAQLDVRARIGSGDEIIAYRGSGVSGDEGVRELISFETASESFAWLNSATAVGYGTTDGVSTLQVTAYLVRD
jgi:hypothetical protein